MIEHTSPRFYGRRKGRPLSTTRKQLLEELLPKIKIDNQSGTDFDPQSLFPGQEVWLEIGFGGGEHLAQQAKHHPHIGMIGCEAYINGVTSLLTHTHNDSLKNVRIYPDDVRPFLKGIQEKSLTRIFVLFPDPWPKKRHHKRRIIGPEQVQEFSRILKPGGHIVIASDDQNYVEAILELMAKFNNLQLVEHVHSPPSDWITTRYEKRAHRLKNKCSYLFYTCAEPNC